jgi:hypothetical protein
MLRKLCCIKAPPEFHVAVWVACGWLAAHRAWAFLGHFLEYSGARSLANRRFLVARACNCN